MTAEESKKLVEIETKLAMFMQGTEAYRQELSASIKGIQDRVNKLPCDSREVKTEGLYCQLRWMWGVLTLMLAAIIGQYFKKG